MKNESLQTEQRFETLVQSIFNTPNGEELLARLALMTDYYANSLIAIAKLRINAGIDNATALIYFNSQRDLAEKIFNCLTHEQTSKLRAAVMQLKYPPKQQQKEEKK